MEQAVKKQTLEDVSRIIRDSVQNAADTWNRPGIVDAATMIPAMEPSHYPKRAYLDLAYGERTEWEKLDVFLPEEGDGPFPVFLEVHGGGWYFGQKRSVEFEPFLAGLKRGYAVVSIGYTLAPQVHYPHPVLEVKAAIRYLKAHAKELHLDAGRIALWGGSAGAHLAGLAAMSAANGTLCDPSYGWNEVKDDVQALVLWYGCFDYYTNDTHRQTLGMTPKSDPVVYQNFLGLVDVESCPDLLKEMNPETHITPTAPPTLFQHGKTDTVVPYLQSVHFAECLSDAIGADKVQLDLLEDCEHADMPLFCAENIEKVYDFVDRYLK